MDVTSRSYSVEKPGVDILIIFYFDSPNIEFHDHSGSNVEKCERGKMRLQSVWSDLNSHNYVGELSSETEVFVSYHEVILFSCPGGFPYWSLG